ncbi:hypothetical protein ABZ851_33355 [Streptomyces sp. NPDC047049]|uniref:hypothetical protein n=1 Tax=Streptomyces sp. NPDC047049 TaxID=3156688 RepID=UPI0034060E16
MYYEIRRYQAQPGRREEWVRYMEDVVIPLQASLGMATADRLAVPLHFHPQTPVQSVIDAYCSNLVTPVGPVPAGAGLGCTTTSASSPPCG